MRLLAIIAVIAAAGAILYFQVWPRLRTPEQRAELEVRLHVVGAGLWARIWARLQSWRTVLLGFLGTAWMMLPDLLQQLQGAPWGDWLDAFWARLIGAGLYLAMVITRIESPGPVGAPPVMPPEAPGRDVLVPAVKQVELVETAKAEGKLS